MPYKDPEKIKEYQKNYREKNKEKRAEAQRKYYLNNINKFAESRLIYYTNNRGKILDNCKRYYNLKKDSFKEKRKLYAKEYYEKNKLKLSDYAKKYYLLNKKKVDERNKKYRAKILAIYRNLKSKLECKVCGEKHIYCLEFHHKDRALKKDTVSRLLNNGSIEAVINEMKKCDVLCSNCHRKIHHKDRIEKLLHYNGKLSIRKKRALWFVGLKSKFKCKICNEKDVACLDFHHKTKDKVKDVSILVSEAASEQRILTEIEKCEAICSNCHRKIHNTSELLG